MNRKISVGMAVSIVILAMTVTFSITMLVAMRLFDSTVSSVKEKESMYNKIAEVDRYVRSNDYYPIDETTLYDRLTAGYLLGTGDKYARYFSATAYTELMNTQNGTRGDVLEQVDVNGRYVMILFQQFVRSEERRVGKECRSRWSPYH